TADDGLRVQRAYVEFLWSSPQRADASAGTPRLRTSLDWSESARPFHVLRRAAERLPGLPRHAPHGAALPRLDLSRSAFGRRSDPRAVRTSQEPGGGTSRVCRPRVGGRPATDRGRPANAARARDAANRHPPPRLRRRQPPAAPTQASPVEAVVAQGAQPRGLVEAHMRNSNRLPS